MTVTGKIRKVQMREETAKSLGLRLTPDLGWGMWISWSSGSTST